MIETVNILLKTGINEILKNVSLSHDLVKCYSKLYLNGQLCRSCESSKRNYYRQLEIDGMTKAEMLEKVKNRTCKPAFKGLVFSPKAGHINPDFLSDELAEFYLLNGILMPVHFEILPENYLKNSKVVEIKQEKIEVPIIETEKPVIEQKEVKKYNNKRK